MFALGASALILLSPILLARWIVLRATKKGGDTKLRGAAEIGQDADGVRELDALKSVGKLNSASE